VSGTDWSCAGCAVQPLSPFLQHFGFSPLWKSDIRTHSKTRDFTEKADEVSLIKASETSHAAAKKPRFVQACRHDVMKRT
jgi:hypothetical protein